MYNVTDNCFSQIYSHVALIPHTLPEGQRVDRKLKLLAFDRPGAY